LSPKIQKKPPPPPKANPQLKVLRFGATAKQNIKQVIMLSYRDENQ